MCPIRRWPAALAILGAVVTLAAACSPSSVEPQASSTTNSPTAAPPTVASLIDPRWMNFDTSGSWNWTEIGRRREVDFQQFGFRPIGETGHEHHCEGCGTNEPTAVVTIYRPGKFDATDAVTGQPVDVDGHGGFLRAYEFNFTAPRGTEREPAFENVLADVQWATDPNDEATWPAVTDWTKGTR
jgi:hypothetical protein